MNALTIHVAQIQYVKTTLARIRVLAALASLALDIMIVKVSE